MGQNGLFMHKCIKKASNVILYPPPHKMAAVLKVTLLICWHKEFQFIAEVA